MNQKGFATILGLCLILAIALVVKGIQESERNHAYQTTDFQTDFDLQNAAESGIYIAVAKVKEDPTILPFNRKLPTAINPRKNYQYKFDRPNISITVDVWGERVLIVPYKEVDYVNQKAIQKDDIKQACAFFSVAELTNSRTGGNLYRRAFAYVLLNDDGTIDTTVHFMNVTAGGYTYNK